MPKDQLLHPVLYLGDKPEKSVDIGRPYPVTFKPGPEFDRPYALLTETEARQLFKRDARQFGFPPGVVKAGGCDCAERVAALEARVAELEGASPTVVAKARRSRVTAEAS